MSSKLQNIINSIIVLISGLYFWIKTDVEILPFLMVLISFDMAMDVYINHKKEKTEEERAEQIVHQIQRQKKAEEKRTLEAFKEQGRYN